MKYKVGDKVRIKSKEWWDAQPKNKHGDVRCGSDMFTDTMICMCGKVVEITDVLENTYFIKEYNYNWTDEMFDDSYNPEKSIISEEMIKDIAEVVKKRNLGVSISEKDGNLIIAPLKGEDDLPIDTPCMCSDDTKDWKLRYYYMNGKFFSYGLKSNNCKNEVGNWLFAIEYNKFDPNNIQESLKYNIVK